MKKYILAFFVFVLVVGVSFVPGLVSAQADIDPNPNEGNCVIIRNNLKYRDRDAQKNGEVSTLQDYLQSQIDPDRNTPYLNSEPTGYFGLLTVQAVKDFQKDNGIEPTGYVGSITKLKIRTLSCDEIVSNTYDVFAQCLASRDLTMYGASWAPHVDTQKDLLGSSFKYIPYVECSNSSTVSQNQTCIDKNITSYPTWINKYNQKFEGVQSLERLSEIGVCELPNTTTIPSIKVLSPNGGETYEVGSTRTIRWSSSNFTGKVSILLLQQGVENGGLGQSYIVQNISNSGVFQWDIPSSVTTNASYKISVGQFGFPNAINDSSDADFTITSAAIPKGCNINPMISASTPMAQSVPAGTNSFNFLTFRVSSGDCDFRINSLFVDDFSYEGGSSAAKLRNVKIMDNRGVQVGRTVSSFSAGIAQVTGINYVVPKNTVRTFSVKADISNSSLPGTTQKLDVRRINYTDTATGESNTTSDVSTVYGNTMTIASTTHDCSPGVVFSPTTGLPCSSITVLSPNGGGSYTAGQEITVRWQANNLPNDGLATIDLIDSNTKHTYIKDAYCSGTSSDPCISINSGSYTFNIPQNQLPGQYKLRLLCSKAQAEGYCGGLNESYATDLSDSYFTITSSAIPRGCSITSFTADPSTINYGGKTKLSYTMSQDCKRFSIPELNYSSLGVAGFRQVGPLYQTSSYTLKASNDEGCAGARFSFTTGRVCTYVSKTVTVNVNSTNILDPSISSVSGDQVLKVGQVGTWTIKASDPSNGLLEYSVVWGDEVGPVINPKNLTRIPFSTQQTATFTHTYNKAGTFVPKFTVTNKQGGKAEASLSVEVGSTQALKPTLTLNSEKSNVSYNESTVIHWTSKNAKVCTATEGRNNWAGNKTLSGTFSTGALTATTTFYMDCYNNDGESIESAIKSITITVGAPVSSSIMVSRDTSFVSPSINAGSTNVELGRFTVSASGGDMKLNTLYFTLDGGVSITNFKALMNGRQISINSQGTSGSNFAVEPNVMIPKWTTAVISLRGDVPADKAVSFKTNFVSLTATDMYSKNVSAGGMPIAGQTINVVVPYLRATMSTSLDTSTSSGQILTAPKSDVSFTKIKVTAGSKDVGIKTIKVVSDSVNASDAVNNIKIYDGSIQLGNTSSSLSGSGNNYYQWVNVNELIIPAGTSKVLTIKANLKGVSTSTGIRLGVDGWVFTDPTEFNSGAIYGNSVISIPSSVISSSPVLNTTLSTPSGNLAVSSTGLTDGSRVVYSIGLFNNVGSANITELKYAVLGTSGAVKSIRIGNVSAPVVNGVAHLTGLNIAVPYSGSTTTNVVAYVSYAGVGTTVSAGSKSQVQLTYAKYTSANIPASMTLTSSPSPLMTLIAPSTTPAVDNSQLSANVISALGADSVDSVDSQVVSSCGEFTMTLSKGMVNGEVKCLQKMLMEKGFKIEGIKIGEETNYFGYSTLVALKNFQVKNQLVVDGIFGPNSEAALKAQ